MENKERNFVSAVICIHDKDKNIFEFLTELDMVFSTEFSNYEFICVCNECAGETIDVIYKFKKEHENAVISIVRMKFEQGLEAMMNAGVGLAIGDYVFEFDSCYIDYRTSLIIELYHRLCEEGYDMMTAVPPKKQSKLSSRIYYYIYNMFSGTQSELRTERFRVISRRAINRISAYSKTIPYRKAVYSACGLNIGTVQYDILQIKTGKYFDDVKKNDIAIDSLILFTDLASKFSVFVVCLMGIFMIIMIGNLVFGDKIGWKIREGWQILSGILAAGFCLIFISFSILVRYLDLMLRLIFYNPRYLVSSIEKI